MAPQAIRQWQRTTELQHQHRQATTHFTSLACSWGSNSYEFLVSYSYPQTWKWASFQDFLYVTFCRKDSCLNIHKFMLTRPLRKHITHAHNTPDSHCKLISINFYQYRPARNQEAPGYTSTQVTCYSNNSPNNLWNKHTTNWKQLLKWPLSAN